MKVAQLSFPLTLLHKKKLKFVYYFYLTIKWRKKNQGNNGIVLQELKGEFKMFEKFYVLF